MRCGAAEKLIFMFACAGLGHAQLRLLTVREAEFLVEHVPDVLNAYRNGECPTSSTSFDGQEVVNFQVRISCGPNSGQLLDNFAVNRRTGSVTPWSDDPIPISDAQLRMITARLISEARKRSLSVSQAKCLAAEASRALPGWSGAGDSVVLKQLGNANRFEGTIEFTATRVSPIRPVSSRRLLTVDLGEPAVRDDETGVTIASPDVGGLLSKLTEMHLPLMLTDEEAASIALVVPRVASNLGAECKLDVGGAFYASYALMGVSCGNRGIAASNVLVNLETGSVEDPDTHKSLNSEETQRLAHKLLSGAQTRRTQIQTAVDQACHAQ